MADKGKRDTFARVRRRVAARTRARNLRDGVLAARVAPLPPAEPHTLRPDTALLASSPLFDHEWYAGCVGERLDRTAAARHYLLEGRKRGVTPHPLFDPDTFASARPQLVGRDDPLVAYLRGRRFQAPTHPLFDTEAYLAAHPAAEQHPGGPVGHFLEIGEPAGARPNDWFRPSDGTPTFRAWLVRERDRWRDRRADGIAAWGPDYDRAGASAYVASRRGPGPAGDAGPLVSVVLSPGDDAAALRRSLDSALAQATPSLEVLVAGDALPPDLAGDPRVRVLPGDGTEPERLQQALAEARGRYVAWMAPGDEWLPGRLDLLVEAIASSGAPLAHDVAEDVSAGPRKRFAARAATPARLVEGLRLELSTVVADVARAREVGFDATLPAAWDHDHLLGLAAGVAEVPFVPVLGVRADRSLREHPLPEGSPEAPRLDRARLDTWHDVVLNRHDIAWDELAERQVDPALVSVIVPTYKDWEMTVQAVQRVADDAAAGDEQVEVIVVDNGCDLVAATVLAALPLRHPRTQVVANGVNHGFALGNNLGLRVASGATVVFLNNDTEVRPGWLGPIREALGQDDVLAAQSLLVFPSGTVQSAGVAFPVGGGVPHELLGGFPLEDADGLENESLHALTGAALALRWDDVVALRGFDPIFRNGMEDIDLCLRLGRLRPGRLVVRPDSQVLHHESRSPGRFDASVTNRRVFLDRWAGELPADDVALWGSRGFEVVGHTPRPGAKDDRRIWQPMPVLTRGDRGRFVVDEPAPRLRWAIKNPAPAGERGDRWGDTHFGAQLADALRGLGQQVVVDRRPEFHRDSGRLDDVVLTLRGLVPYQPAWGQVNLLWLISHPELLGRAEAEGYDRVLAASVAWAEKTSKAWGVRIDPLLQATDPRVFHPDTASPDTGHELLFVGGSRGQLRPMVRDAVAEGLPLSLYGHEWEGLVPDSVVRATYLPNHEVSAAYRSAGIVLNDHWEDMRDEGFLSNRLFDAVASGARVVTDDVAGLREVFGPTVQVARTPAELAALVNALDRDAVFGSDDVRREWAGRIHREHSFAARAQQLLDVALDVRRQSAAQVVGRAAD